MSIQCRFFCITVNTDFCIKDSKYLGSQRGNIITVLSRTSFIHGNELKYFTSKIVFARKPSRLTLFLGFRNLGDSGRGGGGGCAL